MKAAVVHEYGGPDVLIFEDFPDPVAGAGEVLVRVTAASVNVLDLKRRSGAARGFLPIQFPGILGLDLSGTVLALGSGVTAFSVGDKVFGRADQTYAELCVADATGLSKVPAWLNATDAAALPVVAMTGHQLIADGADVGPGQTVFVAGAVGSVGRSAVFTARSRGAVVIAGVRASQRTEAARLGADQVVAIDDQDAIAHLSPVDAIADTIGGSIAEGLLTKVKPGGVFASVLGVPRNAEERPDVRVVAVRGQFDAKVLLFMAEGLRDGGLIIPIGLKRSLKDADKAHAAMERGGLGKVVLLAEAAAD